MSANRYLVTGGTGFIGSALVKRLLMAGYAVRVFDNQSRGHARRLDGVLGDVEMVEGDIRDAQAVRQAVRGCDGVCHLAYVNGTEFFYTMPEVILEIAVKGMTHVIDAMLAEHTPELILASSSEVYQQPPQLPTPEDVPLVVPDVTNPRFSYGGGKVLCELMAINYGRKHIPRVLIFRPHNVYGPDMGWEHVLPQFVLRMRELHRAQPEGTLKFPIQGSGAETRAFTYVEDCVEGILTAMEKGSHLNVYHIGADEELAIAEVARAVGRFYNRQIEVKPGPEARGAATRRCPDIGKLRALGFAPRTPFEDGLAVTARWYDRHADLQPKKS